jgi:hypothetical protein
MSIFDVLEDIGDFINDTVGELSPYRCIRCGQGYIPSRSPFPTTFSQTRPNNGLCPECSAAESRLSRNSFIDNVFKEKVTPVRGSIVCCDLGDPLTKAALLAAEVLERAATKRSSGRFSLDHSGVYVGNGEIVHRDGGGYLASVSPKEFIERLDGWNAAISIYVSCRGEKPVGSAVVARRALAALRDPRHKGYNLLIKNCHQFCQYCLTGEEKGLADCTFTSLQDALIEEYGLSGWHVWDI